MIKKLIGTLALTVLFAANVNAASLSITGPTSVLAGDTFDLTIVGDFSAEGFIAGGINFFWDNSLMTLNSVTRAFGADDFSCPGADSCPPDTANSTAIVWGEFLADLIPIGQGPTDMATLSFTATGTTSEALAVFSMADAGQLTGGWFGAGFSTIDTPGFGELATDVVVPLPAAVWLMFGGLATLLGFRRK